MQCQHSDTSMDFIKSLCGEFQKHNQIDPAYYEIRREARLAQRRRHRRHGGGDPNRQRAGLLCPGR